MVLSNNKGISMTIAAVLVFILVIGVAALQLVALQRFNAATSSRLSIEQEKMEEKIYLVLLENKTLVNGTNYIDKLLVKNAGSIVVKLAAVYVNQSFLFDPSDLTINPNGNEINPNEFLSISFEGLPQFETFEPDSLISVATDRGTKSVAYEKALLGSEEITGVIQSSFGPLILNYTEFYHAKYISLNTIGPWEPGWTISNKEGPVVWKVNATNIDLQNVVLNRTTCLVLMATSSSNVLSWYLNVTSPYLIQSNQTVTLVFAWDTSAGGGTPNSPFSSEGTCQVFIVCFGQYQPKNTPYGQTIPFQSVEVVKG